MTTYTPAYAPAPDHPDAILAATDLVFRRADGAQLRLHGAQLVEDITIRPPYELSATSIDDGATHYVVLRLNGRTDGVKATIYKPEAVPEPEPAHIYDMLAAGRS